MPSKKVVRCARCINECREMIASRLTECFQADVLELMAPYNELIICSNGFSEVYLVSDKLLDVYLKLASKGRYPYCIGIYAGRLSKGILIPSTMLADKVFKKLGTYVNSVEVSDTGLKPFLYGKDVLKASVTRTYPRLIKGRYAFVVGRDGYVYGLGISVVDEGELPYLRPNDVVIKNVFDAGWYLRGGTTPREKKYKLWE